MCGNMTEIRNCQGKCQQFFENETYVSGIERACSSSRNPKKKPSLVITNVSSREPTVRAHICLTRTCVKCLETETQNSHKIDFIRMENESFELRYFSDYHQIRMFLRLLRYVLLQRRYIVDSVRLRHIRRRRNLHR